MKGYLQRGRYINKDMKREQDKLNTTQQDILESEQNSKVRNETPPKIGIDENNT